MAKKLFVVSIETEVVVLADDEREAEREAERIPLGDCTVDYHAAPMAFMPADWDETAIPFGKTGESERTIGEWVKLGAAPKYVELNERLLRAKRQLGAKDDDKP